MRKKYIRNFNPYQLAAFSGSVALDLPTVEGESFTSLSAKRDYLFSSFAPSFEKDNETSDESQSLDNEDVERFTQESREHYSDIKKRAAEVFHFRPSRLIRNRFLEQQKWEGYVLQVSKDIFYARLVDLTESGLDEEAEFSIEEIHHDDRPLIKRGAVFYWNIGYLENNGQRIRASVVRFRRLPKWKSEEIDSAKQHAQQLRNLLQRE